MPPEKQGRKEKDKHLVISSAYLKPIMLLLNQWCCTEIKCAPFYRHNLVLGSAVTIASM